MREIKYRFWDKTGAHGGTPAMSPSFTLAQVGRVLGAQQVDLDAQPWIVMQFTGLRDKHGKEIYEGEIIQSNLENEMGSFEQGVAQVVWCGMNSCVGFHLRQKGQSEQEGYSIGTDCEVIGNVYEHPELLV